MKTAKKKNAQQLVQQLDQLALKQPGAEIALCTSLGLIFSWQTHKLSNLAFALEHGWVIGFITVEENADDAVDIHLCPLSKPEDANGTLEDVLDLVKKIDNVLEVCHCGPEFSEVDPEDNFRTGFKLKA